LKAIVAIVAQGTMGAAAGGRAAADAIQDFF
jgi:hypothetical protein